jgi:Tfp pilus assembly protein PilF/peroxiredoxin
LRNTTAGQNQFVTLKLQGTTCNRDAIGARAELYLVGTAIPRIATVRAGEGYLAQSTKWLHFGLQPDEVIDRIVVRWPGGDPEEFREVSSNGRFLLVQGSARAIGVPLPEPTDIKFDVRTLEAPGLSEEAHIVLAERVALPPLNYVDFDGNSQPVFTSGKAHLINLWASWCRPCLQELSEFVKIHEEFRARDLDVLPISVDESSQKGAAEAALRRVGWTGREGLASEELVRALDGIQRSLLDHKKQMPVPTSFLVDAQGRLAAIYKGPAPVEQLRADLDALDSSDAENWSRAIPFSGTWIERPSVLAFSHLGIARHFTREQEAELAAFYVDLVTKAAPPEALPEDAEGRATLAATQLNLAAEFFRTGDKTAAVRLLHEAIRYRPEFAKAYYNLAVILQTDGIIAEAEANYQKALQADPAHVESLFNLGHIRLKQGALEEAARLFGTAVEIRPDFVPGLRDLAYVLLRLNQVPSAEQTLVRAVEFDAANADLWFQLGNTQLAQRRPDAAVKAYQEAVRARPEFAEAFTNLAGAQLMLGEKENAKTNLMRVVELVPSDAKAHLNLAKVLLQLAESDRARESAEAALSLTQKSGDEAGERRVREFLDQLR